MNAGRMCLHKNCSLSVAPQKKTLSWKIMRVRQTCNVSGVRKEWSWKRKSITLCYQYSCWVLTGVQLTWSFGQFKSKLWQQSYILKLTWLQQYSVVTRIWPFSSPSLSTGFYTMGLPEGQRCPAHIPDLKQQIHQCLKPSLMTCCSV